MLWVILLIVIIMVLLVERHSPVEQPVSLRFTTLLPQQTCTLKSHLDFLGSIQSKLLQSATALGKPLHLDHSLSIARYPFYTWVRWGNSVQVYEVPRLRIKPTTLGIWVRCLIHCATSPPQRVVMVWEKTWILYLDLSSKTISYSIFWILTCF